MTTSTPVIHAVRGVAAGLRDDVAELHLRSARARQCAITALAVTLATTIALEVPVEATWWAAIGAFVSIRTTAPASMQHGALCIIDAATGAEVRLLSVPYAMIESNSTDFDDILKNPIAVLKSDRHRAKEAPALASSSGRSRTCVPDD